MQLSRIPRITALIWFLLLAEAFVSLLTGRWSTLFISISVFALTTLPFLFSGRFHIELPNSFVGALTAFIFATLFLGEVYDFYERFWWWDVALHGLSAIGFGIVGFLFVFALFQGDRYAAPPWAVGVITFGVALAIGALWEIFEFGMDQVFGLNMQKSGLTDTMWDLIVDTAGAFLAAFSGFLWLLGQNATFGRLIDEFIRRNRRLFSRGRESKTREK